MASVTVRTAGRAMPPPEIASVLRASPGRTARMGALQVKQPL